jgi:predicted nucleic acid-binding Zn ribbon protein
MPTYVYRFVDTGETIEVQQSFADPALTEATHPTTGEVLPVRKVFTPVGVTFRGGGFYKTDSRGKSTTRAKKDETSSTSKESTSKEPASTESKPKESKSSGSAAPKPRKDSSTTTAGSGRD